MGEITAIGWTDHTFNPWWGCTRVSPGCEHCYAEAFAKRTGHKVWGKTAGRRYFEAKHWAEPLKWNRDAEAIGKPALVFCASMADVFERTGSGEQTTARAMLFSLITDTPWLRWQLLTKRPENVLDLVPASWLTPEGWPSNAWIGTTVEDQKRADERIPILLEIPAPVRFLSMEPLLEVVELRDEWLDHRTNAEKAGVTRGDPDDVAMWIISGKPQRWFEPERRIDWIICGGESGPGHRPLDLEAAYAVRVACTRNNVPFFFKQVGGARPTSGGDLLYGELWKEFPTDELADRGVVALEVRLRALHLVPVEIRRPR